LSPIKSPETTKTRQTARDVIARHPVLADGLLLLLLPNINYWTAAVDVNLVTMKRCGGICASSVLISLSCACSV